MTVTMAVQKIFNQRAVLRVVSKVYNRGKSLFFDQTYVAANTYGERILYPGMLVAFSSDKTQYVPWSAASSYGTYSSYFAGILDDLFDFTFESQVVAPATRAVAIEEHCYVYGGAVGTVPAAIKQATGNNFEGRLIEWD